MMAGAQAMAGARAGAARPLLAGFSRLGVLAGCLAALAACAATAPGQQLPPAPETAAERAVAQRGDDWLAIGKRLLEVGEPELAMKAFERSLLREGPSAEAFTGAGLAAEAQGLATMAARYFERARTVAPNSMTAHNNLGVVLLGLGDYYPARQAFQAAFALSDGRSDLALSNLRRSEKLVAALEDRRGGPDPATNFRVERLGRSEFRLVEWRPPEPAVETERPGAPDAPRRDSGGPGT